MHIPKSLAVLFLTVFTTAALQAQKTDTPEQAKARQALEEAMKDPAMQPPAPAVKAAPAKPAPAPAKPAPTAAAPAKPSPAPAAAAATATAAGTAKTLTPEEQAKAQQALDGMSKELDAQQKTPVATTPPPTAKPAPVAVAPVAAKPAPTASMQPAAAPAPSSQERQLSDLLEQYKADKITPQEYHAKRAQILGGK